MDFCLWLVIQNPKWHLISRSLPARQITFPKEEKRFSRLPALVDNPHPKPKESHAKQFENSQIYLKGYLEGFENWSTFHACVEAFHACVHMEWDKFATWKKKYL